MPHYLDIAQIGRAPALGAGCRRFDAYYRDQTWRYILISDEMLAEAVKINTSMMGVLRYLGCKLQGGTHVHYTKRARSMNLDMTHFTGKAWNKGIIGATVKRTTESILVLRDSGRRQKSHLLVRAMLDSNVKHECSRCGQKPEWNGNPMTLDVDHINENWLDDRVSNLQFLCPNCHSQYSRNLIERCV